MVQAVGSDSAFTFLVLVRKGFRNRLPERRRLSVLLEDILERYRSPVIVAMCKRNNISVMQTAVVSEDIIPIVFDEYGSGGEYINAVMKQVRTPYLMVLWDDMRMEGRLGEQLVRQLLSTDTFLSAPFCYDHEITLIPTQSAPLLSKQGQLSVLPALPSLDTEKTLFPFDYVGLYLTDAFRRGPGFDPEMDDGFWQLTDFGLSYWERELAIRMNSTLMIRYLHSHTMNFTQECSAEKRFHAKHFGYTVKPEGVKYTSKARRMLHHGKEESSDSSVIRQRTEAEVLIAAWEEL
jgi:hypothetical protein